MTKFTIVRNVTVEEIYEVVANTPTEAIKLAEAGEGLTESFATEQSGFRVENSVPGFDR